MLAIDDGWELEWANLSLLKSGGVGVTERTAYILKVRQLAVGIARAYVDAMTPRADAGGAAN